MNKMMKALTAVYDFLTCPMEPEFAERMDAILATPEPKPMRRDFPNYYSSHEEFMKNYRPVS